VTAREQQEAVSAVLDKHLGKRPVQLPGHDLEAWQLVFIASDETGQMKVWSIKKELEKIARVEEAAQKLSEEYQSLQSSIRFSIWTSALGKEQMDWPQGQNDDFSSAPPGVVVLGLNALPGLLAPHLDAGRKRARKPEQIGRKKWQSVSIVDYARQIWAKHKGEEAPEGGVNEASPFADFLRDLFAVLGVKANIRAAFDAWKRWVQSCEEKNL